MRTIRELIDLVEKTGPSELTNFDAIRMFNDATSNTMLRSEYLDKHLDCIDITEKQKIQILTIFGAWDITHS
jgi:hypothetical protein